MYTFLLIYNLFIRNLFLIPEQIIVKARTKRTNFISDVFRETLFEHATLIVLITTNVYRSVNVDEKKKKTKETK